MTAVPGFRVPLCRTGGVLCKIVRSCYVWGVKASLQLCTLFSARICVRINMRRFRFCLVLLVAICVALALPAEGAKKKKLPARIAAILSEPDLARGFWGIEIRSLDSGVVLYSQNAEKLFTPA